MCPPMALKTPFPTTGVPCLLVKEGFGSRDGAPSSGVQACVLGRETEGSWPDLVHVQRLVRSR
jgi:hypothetical protein